jgi:hypothetical protein
MKDEFITKLGILALAGAFSIGMAAQTTEPGPGPSEHPDAPMEIGAPRAQQPPYAQAPQPGQQQPPDQQQPGPPQPGQAQPSQPPQMGPEAQPGGPSGEGPAKVNQGVGHISMIHGDVSTQRGDSGTWSAAILNQPVLMGDKVSTGANARAEVQLDYANILRLGANAQANMANFTNKYIQIQVGQGLVNYTVWGESEAEPEIDTPNVGVHPAHQDGVYRIEVRPDGDSIVIVRKGDAQISTPQGIAEVKQGEMATVRGAGTDARYKISPAPPRDDWDVWNGERDHMIHSADSWKHTNRYYTGSEDLDAYGRWENVPDYGDVWVPNEPGDWAPYRDGNWVWEPYYGWTWAGYEPWGWAPYHYGRWFWYGSSWAWWPGPVWGGYEPFWAPAYVSFFGWPGWGFGFGFGWGGWGGFGWLPIGPCDRFFPWWGGYGGRFGWVGFNHLGGLNRFGGIAPLHAGTRFSNVAHMNDPHISGGMSTVAANRFGAGRTTAVAASHAQLSGARMMTGNMPVVPTRASLSASGRAAAPSTIHSGAAQHFFGTQNTAHTQSFEQQTAHLQQAMQQNHVSAAIAGGRETASQSRGSSAGKPSAGTPSTRAEGASSERASSEHSAASSASRNESATTNRAGSSNSEWRSFTPRSQSTSRSAEPAGREGGAQAYSRGESGSYWNRTGSSSNYSRGYGSSAYGGSGGYSRPQLNMRQPIAQPRSGGYGGYGGYHGAPSYGGSRGGYSGGSHSAPSGGGGHSSGGGGGGHGGSGGGGHR